MGHSTTSLLWRLPALWNMPRLFHRAGYNASMQAYMYSLPHKTHVLVCSLCIRQHFSLCQECPTCRRIYAESIDLDPNHTVDEIVDAFKSIRHSLMKTINESKARKENTIADQGQCPICNGFFDASKMEAHVDKCLDKQRHDEASIKAQRQPISKPVFALMKDAQLKKTLADYGLPTTGERSVSIACICIHVIFIL